MSYKALIPRNASLVKWVVRNTFTIISKGFYGRLPKGSRVVYFDLKDNPYDRYLTLFFMFLEISGYHVAIKFRSGFVGKWATALALQSCKNVDFVFRRPQHTLASFTNDPNRESDFDFLLSHDYFSTNQNGHFVPMPMVDSFYEQKIFKQAFKDMPRNLRSIGIFFAGRFQGYTRNEVQDLFHCFSRTQLLNLLKVNFSKELVLIKEASDLEQQRVANVVIVDRDQANISPQQLPGVLSRSNFFLCFPGVVMPLCHNAIEAMAFGCIPILQYPNLFHPPLEHGINCLSFSDEQTFKTCISEGLQMSENQTTAMRMNVLEYYHEYLAPESAIANVLKEKGIRKKLFLNAEYQSVKLLERSIDLRKY